MTCVVDASVSLKWFLADEPNAEEALSLVERREEMIAPDLLIAETCNAAWRLLRTGRITRTQFHRIPAVLPRYLTELVGASTLAPRAAAIAADLDHPVYDCLYLALAETRQVPLVTADSRLLAKVAGSPWAGSATHVALYRPAG